MPHKNMDELGKEIKESVIQKYVRQAAFCEKYNENRAEGHIDRSFVSRVINGKYKTLTKKIAKICKFLKIETDIEGCTEADKEIVHLIHSIPREHENTLKIIIKEIANISSHKGK